MTKVNWNLSENVNVALFWDFMFTLSLSRTSSFPFSSIYFILISKHLCTYGTQSHCWYGSGLCHRPLHSSSSFTIITVSQHTMLFNISMPLYTLFPYLCYFPPTPGKFQFILKNSQLSWPLIRSFVHSTSIYQPIVCRERFPNIVV